MAVVASGACGSAPAAWLCCLKEQRRAVGSKSLERTHKGFGKRWILQVTVDHAHCKEKAVQETEDTVQTCWLASIVSLLFYLVLLAWVLPTYCTTNLKRFWLHCLIYKTCLPILNTRTSALMYLGSDWRALRLCREQQQHRTHCQVK